MTALSSERIGLLIKGYLKLGLSSLTEDHAFPYVIDHEMKESQGKRNELLLWMCFGVNMSG